MTFRDVATAREVDLFIWTESRRSCTPASSGAAGGRQGVVEVLHQLIQQHRLPKTIRVDNGPEFTSKRLGPVGLPERSGVGLEVSSKGV